MFFNQYYKIKPPESVRYYKTKDSARARLANAKDGSLQMEIQGEKYPFAGFPRGHVLMGSLAGLKKKIKDSVFNQVFNEIDKMYAGIKDDAIPVERCCPAVREISRVMDILENMEIVEDMKARMRLIKKVLVFFLQEDDAYRFRVQMFLDLVDRSKTKMSKADKYYARGKYWKVDFDKFDY